MSQLIRPFHIMAKPVCGVCNLDCRYCYYSSKPRELYPDVPRPMMPEPVLEEYTRQYMDVMPVRCEFGWQGGEPLLAGREFFRKAVELQKQFHREGQVLANALQTNGTLLDEQWCEFLAEHSFLVGLSLDGPPRVHDRFRLDHAGNSSWHRAWAGLELARKHRVEFNVLVTLNSADMGLAGDLYRYFVNRGVQYLQFIPILERDPDGSFSDYSCTPEQYGRFLLETFEQWAARDIGRISERFIDNVIHTLIYGVAALCCYAERCANAHVLEWNGDLYVCDHFVYRQWKLGNLMETPLVELVQTPLLEQFAALKSDLPAGCRDCEYLPFCRGGCPKHHVPIGTDPDRVNYYCQAYKMFFREALPELRRIADYIRRGQMPPPRIPTGLGQSTPAAGSGQAAPASAGAAAPKRNDPCPCGSGRKFKACCGRTP